MLELLRGIGYFLVLGKPLVLWLGLTTIALFAGALSIILLNNHTKIRIPIEWHPRLAISGLILGLIHGILAMSAYF